jgi:hypothetical protein
VGGRQLKKDETAAASFSQAGREVVKASAGREFGKRIAIFCLQDRES